MPKVARPAGSDRPANLDESRPDIRPDPRPPSLARRAAGRAFRPAGLCAVGLMILCAALAPWVARRLPDLGQRSEYALVPDGVRLDPPPPHPVPADLAARVLGDEPASILEPGLAERLAKGFRKHPWVRRVKGVRVGHPATAEIELVYRTPVAAVAVNDGLYPIDAAGVLLPPADFTRPAADALPRVEGAFAVPGPAGTAWPDDAVLGAAAVCESLAGVWDDCDLAAVRPLPPGSEAYTGKYNGAADDFAGVFGDDADPEPADAEVQYELLTRGGSRVVWGRAPGSGHPGELAAAEKRNRLTGPAREILAGARVPQRVDLRTWDGIYYAPLPAADRGGARTAGRATPPATRR